MVHFLASAARSAVVPLRCPHCGHVQARARVPAMDTVRFMCKACRASFTGEEGKLREHTPR